MKSMFVALLFLATAAQAQKDDTTFRPAENGSGCFEVDKITGGSLFNARADEKNCPAKPATNFTWGVGLRCYEVDTETRGKAYKKETYKSELCGPAPKLSFGWKLRKKYDSSPLESDCYASLEGPGGPEIVLENTLYYENSEYRADCAKAKPSVKMVWRNNRCEEVDAETGGAKFRMETIWTYDRYFMERVAEERTSPAGRELEDQALKCKQVVPATKVVWNGGGCKQVDVATNGKVISTYFNNKQKQCEKIKPPTKFAWEKEIKTIKFGSGFEPSEYQIKFLCWERDIKTNGMIVHRRAVKGCGAEPVVHARWNPAEKKCETKDRGLNLPPNFLLSPVDHCPADPALKFVSFREKCFLIDKATSGKELRVWTAATNCPNFDPNGLVQKPEIKLKAHINSSERSSGNDEETVDRESGERIKAVIEP